MQHMFFADPLQQYSGPPIEISTSKNSMSSIDCMSGTTHSRAESIERTSILVAGGFDLNTFLFFLCWDVSTLLPELVVPFLAT